LLSDFAPIPAMVSGLGHDWVVLNKGKEHGISSGDLFQIYSAGAPVKASGTGRLIGHLKEKVATVQVIKLKKKSSVCQLISRENAIIVGQPAMRFKDVTAVFTARSAQLESRKFGKELRGRLPNLIWVSTDSIIQPLSRPLSTETLGVNLLFLLGPDGLKVYGPGMSLIHEYNQCTGSSKGKKNADVQPYDLMEMDGPGGRSALSGYEFDFSNMKIVGRLPVPAVQIDVTDVDQDGRTEIVCLLSSALYIHPFRNKGSGAVFGFAGAGWPAGFSVDRSDGWIAVNIILEKVGMRSVLLRYSNGRLYCVQGEINLWLAFVDMDGDGARESLLGQSFNGDTLFGSNVFLLNYGPEGISYRERLDLPAGFSVLRTCWEDLNGNGIEEICTVGQDGRIRIYEMGTLVWSGQQPVAEFSEGKGQVIEFIPGSVLKTGSGVIFLHGRADTAVSGGCDALMGLTWNGRGYSLDPVSPCLGRRICGLAVLQDRFIAGVTAEKADSEGTEETLLYSAEPFKGENAEAKKPVT